MRQTDASPMPLAYVDSVKLRKGRATSGNQGLQVHTLAMSKGVNQGVRGDTGEWKYALPADTDIPAPAMTTIFFRFRRAEVS